MKTTVSIAFAIFLLAAPIQAQLTVGSQPKKDTVTSATQSVSVRAWWNQNNTRYAAEPDGNGTAGVIAGVLGVPLPRRSRTVDDCGRV